MLMITTILLLCLPCMSQDWTLVERHKFINYDLEGRPLQIKTDSETGSKDYLSLVLHKADATKVDDYVEVGYIEIQFSTPLKYYVHHCYETKIWYELVAFPTTPPAEQNKIWTFTKSFTDLAIDCNGVRVLDLNFEEHSRAECATKWSQDVAKIVFYSKSGEDNNDNASDMYRMIPTCHTLPEIAHLELLSGQLPVNQGTKVAVKCREGYSLEGDNLITCQQENVFTGNPSCHEIKCTGLDSGWNHLTTETTFPVDTGTELTVSCEDGFLVSGSDTITCTEGTTFSSATTPSCVRKQCTGLDSAWNDLTTETTFPVDTGTELTVSCEDGFLLSGSDTITCTEGTTFSSVTTPSCVRKQCTGLDSAWNDLTTETTFPVDTGTELTVSCENGFLLSGSDTITCTEGTTFSSVTTLSCVRKQCTGLDPAWNHLITETTFPVDTGTELTVSCKDGFLLSGSDTITCTEGTTFSSVTTPSCVRKQCTGLDPAWNDLTTETTFPVDTGTELTVSCEDGFLLSGSDTITCTEGTTFSSVTTPSCVRKQCTGLDPAWNYLTTETTFPVDTGTELTVSCEDGFLLSGSDTITCTEGTTFSSVTTPSCVRKQCTGLDPAWNDLTTETTFPVDTGTELTVSCEDWFLLSGSDTITCTEGTTFSSVTTPSCVRKQCTGLDPAWNDLTTETTFPVDTETELTVSCKDGFLVSGSDTITCAEGTTFSSVTTPYCVRKQCTGLDSAWNDLTTETTFPVDTGTELTVSCEDGFLLSGSDTITCTEGTTFSSVATPSCVRKQCTGVDPAWNDLTTETTFPVDTGTELTVSCEDGFLLSGSDTITCTEGTTFSSVTTPSCVRKQCSGLDPAWNDLTTETTFPVDTGTELRVSCEDEFLLKGSDTITCTEGTTFSSVTTPSCVRKQCTGLDPAWIDLTTETTFPVDTGTELTVSCEDGFLVSGSDTITCTEGTNFSSVTTPSCVRKQCTGLDSAWNHLTTETTFPVDTGTELTVSCKDGFLLSGSDTITCTEGTTFSSVTTPSCVRKQCTGLDPAWNDLATEITFPVDTGTELTVSCEDGFLVSGSDTITCTEGTTFSSVTTPSCVRKQCTGLDSAWNHLTTETTFPVDTGTELTVSCKDGFLLSGSDTITCTEGTTFSSVTTPSCVRKQCTGLDPAWNDLATEITFPVDTGTELTVSCEDGFHLRGSKTITCTEGTTFSSVTTPICIQKHWTLVERHEFINYDLEGRPLQIKTDSETGSKDYLSLVLHKADATDVDDYVEVGYIEIQFSTPLKYYVHHCYVKTIWYELVAFPTTPPAEKNKIWTFTKSSTDLAIDCNGVRVLDLNFEKHSRAECATKWSQDVAKIVFYSKPGEENNDNASDMYRMIPTCHTLPEIAHLELLSGQLPVNQGTKVAVKCRERYSLEGDNLITCQQENVFTGNPSCHEIKCTGLDPAWNHLTTETTFPVDTGTELTVSCEDGFLLSGSDTITCTEGTTFSSVTTPSCVRKQCTGLDPAWNDLTTETTFPVDTGTELTVSCEDGFLLSGSDTITCTEGTTFSSVTTPSCVRKQCTGLDPAWNHLTTETTFPVDTGTELTVSCEDVFHLRGSKTITCTEGTTFLCVTTPICIQKQIST
ncbi:hypothetical protein ACHWQZ_G018378 [Mnemiopsis leidyi]